MIPNIFKAQYQPEQVRGHQLERLRLRLLQLPRKPMRPVCTWDGQHLRIGRPSRHRTLSGRHSNMIARIKRRLRGRPGRLRQGKSRRTR